MTKSELTAAIICKRHLIATADKRLVEAAVDDVFDILSRKIIEDGNVKLSRFGSFNVVFFRDKPHIAFEPSTRLVQLLRRQKS